MALSDCLGKCVYWSHGKVMVYRHRQLMMEEGADSDLPRAAGLQR